MLQLTASIIASTWEHDPCVGIRFQCGWSTVPFKSSKTEKPEIGANLNMHIMSGCRTSPPALAGLWSHFTKSANSDDLKGSPRQLMLKKTLLFIIKRQIPRTAHWSRCPDPQNLSASSTSVELLTTWNKIFIFNYYLFSIIIFIMIIGFLCEFSTSLLS